MAHQLIAGTFRQQLIPGALGNIIQNNLSDTNAAAGIGWTGGGTIIEQVSIQQSLGATWSIVGWSISCCPYLVQANGAGRSYGKLGKLIGGMVHLPPTPVVHVPNYDQPWVNPMLPFPTDTAGLAVIWDGASDPAPPWFDTIPATYAGTKLAPVTVNVPLPIPIRLYPGEDIEIGLWATPALVQNTQLVVAQANYTVIYDDNQPDSPSVWGSG